ncbi:LPS export ABC transporter ATP-binding protein [candidate division NPL-UPA2 bacterium Unc8]|uniref:LPS export ABC transporter ATP-binding protein n=1 Tax=candidate division NPL-UPA2 bacterium Unc8 TaxID=1980939 RepID=A0A399FUR4_UNCN2|nr:Lipopolysaccharide export system ATP-binding protein LptB [Bacillota bacterium]RIH99863.1 MAG: LPS export ABC transporter ATP-binding protein [candidate division NPL-UPA2 bacterium Unc8]
MLLKAEGLVKFYNGRCIVNRVSLEVRKGEIVGLLGPNGAGKTTTFHMMVGLVTPGDGKVYLGEDNLTRLPMYLRARKGIGYLPQESSVFRGLTVAENILAVLETIPITRRNRQQRCEEILKEFKLSHISRQKAFTLSGGETRRVEIARALVTSPSFILFDEPFTGIDPITISDIQRIIISLKEKGYGILITDHSVRETLEITNRAYIIYEGKILFSGTSTELIEHEEARKVYLGKNFRF